MSAKIVRLTTRPTSKMGAARFYGEWERTLRDRETFKTSGSLRGERAKPGYFSTDTPGRLDIDSVYYSLWLQQRDSIDYVVYSYFTPIAWHVSGVGWTMTQKTSYSVSTTRHQSLVYSTIKSL